MTVYNYGIIVRYRYPFILLLFICYNNILGSKNENNINFRASSFVSISFMNLFKNIMNLN